MNGLKFKNVPVKYNGDLLDNLKNGAEKYCFFIDYLNLNLSGVPELNESENLKFDFQKYGTPIFEKRVLIEFNGQKFGTLVYLPHSDIINPLLCQLKLENHLFYTLPLPKLKKVVNSVIKSIGLTFTNVNRLDLALDFQNSCHDVTEMLKSVAVGSVLISGREKEIDLYSRTKAGKMMFTGVKVGKRTGSRFLRIYDKPLEMLEKGNKSYITESWEKSGLNGQIWRYEFQLNSKYFRDLEAENKAFDFDNIFDLDSLFALFQSANKGFFELRVNTSKKEVNKNPVFLFLDFSKIRQYLKVVSVALSRLKRKIKETFIGQKRMVKGLLRSYFSTGQKLEFILPLKHILNDFRLWDWFSQKLPVYVDEFAKTMFIVDYDRKKMFNDLAVEI